jgi:hypothetical protein
MPNSGESTEVFGPRAVSDRRRLTHVQSGQGSWTTESQGPLRLIKMGWPTLTDVRCYFNPHEYAALAHYNEKPDEQRCPFVVES